LTLQLGGRDIVPQDPVYPANVLLTPGVCRVRAKARSAEPFEKLAEVCTPHGANRSETIGEASGPCATRSFATDVRQGSASSGEAEAGCFVTPPFFDVMSGDRKHIVLRLARHGAVSGVTPQLQKMAWIVDHFNPKIG